MTPDEQEAHERFVENHYEETYIREDTQMMGCMAMVIFAHVMAALWFLSAFTGLRLPSWTAVFLAVPVILAPKLYALWRLGRSELPLRIHSVLVKGREKRHWLIIAAVVIAASLIATLLAPMVRESLGDW